MKRRTDSERLLDDVLADDPGFDAATLDATLIAVRRWRVTRFRRRVALGASVALLTLFAAILRPWFSERDGRPADSDVAVAAPPGGSAVVSSRPLAASMLVETSVRSVSVIESDGSSVTLVETVAVAPLVPRIDEAELYTILAGRPFAIVRPKDAPAELLLLTSERPADFLGQ